MIRVVVYGRTSNKDESIEKQIDELTFMILQSKDREIVKIIKDEEVSNDFEPEARKHFPKIFKMAEEKEFDELWVASIDRLAKDIDVVGYIRTLLRRQGIKVVSLDDSVEKAFNGPKDASDEMGLDKYQEKRMNGIDRAIREHRTLQRPPFGYTSVDKKLVIDERYRGLIKELFKDFENQNMSIKKLSLKYGLAPSLIQRIRSNPIYTTGEVKWQGKIVYHVEPIVKGEGDEEGED